MNTVELALELCKKWEGFRSRPYLCPAGVPTIGYGSTYYKDGTRVTLHDSPITKQEAEDLLRYELIHTYLPAVRRQCPQITGEGRIAAIVDFTYNLGEGKLKYSTLRKRINSDDWDDVPNQLRKWVWAGGKKLRGLVLRREDEIKLL